jgi:hypothetical protein
MSAPGTLEEPVLYLALVHAPVRNRRGEEIAAAITNLDLHDLARLACTYDLPACYVVTPLQDQQELVHRLIHHWLHGVGSRLHPDRERALRRLRVRAALEDVVADVERECGRAPFLWATSARSSGTDVEPTEARLILETTGRPGVMVFGTGWGLAERVWRLCHGTLRPVEGRSDYNHLSVRCAAAILVDRFFREGSPPAL